MRIGFATTDWAMKAHDPLTGRPSYGGSGWYRMGMVARHLRNQGIFEVFEGTLVFHRPSGTFGVREWPEHDPEAEDAPFQIDLDVIVMQRWMLASVAAESETARRAGQVVIQDVDDHFWALDPRNRAHHSTDPLKDRIENRDHYLRAVQAASLVTTSTPYLADALRRLGVKAPIEVVENRVDVQAFETSRPRLGEEPWDARPVVGWVGAIPWRSGDLEVLAGVLGPFLARHGLLAYHGGHLDVYDEDGQIDQTQTFAHQAQVNALRVRKRSMVPIFEYPDLFGPLDIGLVPLRDIPFNRAKSWIKGLEYAAAGVPFVASETPEYRRLALRYGIGRLAKRGREWTRHLAALLDDDVRAEEGAKNRDRVADLDIRLGIHEWRDLYLDALAKA